jgi:hypothetical protein
MITSLIVCCSARQTKPIMQLCALCLALSKMRSNKSAPNNAINSDSKMWRAFVAPLFTAGYGER